MKPIAASFALAVSMSVFPAVGQVATGQMDQILSSAARSLAGMQFDANAT